MFSSFAAQVQRTTSCSVFFIVEFTWKARTKKACRTPPDDTPWSTSVFRLPEVRLQRLRDLFLRPGSDNLLHHLPVLEQQQRRDSANVVASRRIDRFIHVQFHHLELAFVVLSDLGHRRRQHMARPAPLGPES